MKSPFPPHDPERPQNDRERFWVDHYNALAISGASWLDYGNERVQQQTLDLAIAAAEPVSGARCLDMGCGRGQLAIALCDRGATNVTACDASPVLIDRLRQERPDMHWIHHNVCSTASTDIFPNAFDRVFAIEVLQYVPFEEALSRLWHLTAAGGRLIGVVPNRECPFLTETITRFSGHYNPPNPDSLALAVQGLEGVSSARFQGLWYTQRRDSLPYRGSEFGENVSWNDPPNRVLFAVDRIIG